MLVFQASAGIRGGASCGAVQSRGYSSCQRCVRSESVLLRSLQLA